MGQFAVCLASDQAPVLAAMPNCAIPRPVYLVMETYIAVVPSYLHARRALQRSGTDWCGPCSLRHLWSYRRVRGAPVSGDQGRHGTIALISQTILAYADHQLVSVTRSGHYVSVTGATKQSNA